VASEHVQVVARPLGSFKCAVLLATYGFNLRVTETRGFCSNLSLWPVPGFEKSRLGIWQLSSSSP
jgi:hypothetical protein